MAGSTMAFMTALQALARTLLHTHQDLNQLEEIMPNANAARTNKVTPTTTSTETTAKPEPSVTERAARAAHRVVDQVAEKAASAEESVREHAARTQGQVSSSTEEIKAKASDGLATAESYVRENPLAAAGIAFAAGVLASVLLRR